MFVLHYSLSSFYADLIFFNSVSDLASAFSQRFESVFSLFLSFP